MRKVILRVAASLDGFIARRDASLDWIPDGNLDAIAGVDASFLKSVDTALMGRKTYQQACMRGAPALGVERRVIFSTKRPSYAVLAGEEWTDCDVASLVRELRSERGDRAIWLAGGAEIIAACLGGDVVDEITITTVPVLLGDGVRLFPETNWSTRLRLLEMAPSSEGNLRHTYAVLRPCLAYQEATEATVRRVA